MHWEIKKIDLWSAVKISFVANGVLGFGVGLFLSFTLAAMSQFLAPFMAMSGQDPAELASATSLGSVIMMPFFMGFFMAVVYGVIVTGILVLIYNLVAKMAGGIKMTLQPEGVVQVAEAPPPGGSKSALGYE